MIISSKNKNSLKLFLKFLKSLAKKKDLSFHGNYEISQRKTFSKFFTILKSPHINKTAQEQFEFRLFTKNVKITTFQILKVLIVFKKILTIIFAELKFSLKLNLDLRNKSVFFSRLLKPQNGILCLTKLFFVKMIQLTFSLFNFYGKQKLIFFLKNTSV